MKLSVILPCFNGVKTIAVQLEALARRWSEPWELVVINNGSTNDSMQIVENYRDRLPNLPLVRKRYGVGMGKLKLINRTIALLGHVLKVEQVFNRTEFASWLNRLPLAGR